MCYTLEHVRKWQTSRLVLHPRVSLICHNIPSVPHQPTNFEFPKRAFGKTKVVYRSFQPAWHFKRDNGHSFIMMKLLLSS